MDSEHQELPQLVTIEEAARRLSVSRRTIHREINRGRFPRPLKIGTASRVELSAVLHYLERLRAEVAP